MATCKMTFTVHHDGASRIAAYRGALLALVHMAMQSWVGDEIPSAFLEGDPAAFWTYTGDTKMRVRLND